MVEKSDINELKSKNRGKIIDPLKIFDEVKLYLDDREFMFRDAAKAKHIYGGLKE